MDGGGYRQTEKAVNGRRRLEIDGADCEWIEEAGDRRRAANR